MRKYIKIFVASILSLLGFIPMAAQVKAVDLVFYNDTLLVCDEHSNKKITKIIVKEKLNKLDRAFVVDKIQFKKPLVISYDRMTFICEDKVFKKNKKIKYGFWDPDIYVYISNVNDVRFWIFKEGLNIMEKDPECLFTESAPIWNYSERQETSNHITLYRFNKLPDYYYLVLYPINGLILDGKFIYTDVYAKKLKQILNTYVRLVIPVYDNELRNKHQNSKY